MTLTLKLHSGYPNKPLSDDPNIYHKISYTQKYYTSTILNFRDNLMLNNHHNYHFNTEVKILCFTYSPIPNVVVSAFAVVPVRNETRADDAGDAAGTDVGFSECDAVHYHECM